METTAKKKQDIEEIQTPTSPRQSMTTKVMQEPSKQSELLSELLATMEATEKTDLLQQQTAQLCAALMAKQPPHTNR